jgi:UDP-N-acetylglucosamine acyltransferase
MSQLAYIHSGASIGADTVVEPFASIYDDVVIGKNCWIGPNAVIMPGTTIGDNCRIFPGAVIGAVPQDLKYKGEYTTTEIGNNVTIRECVTINKGTTDKMKTSVGDNCLLMAYVHVAHDCQIGKNCIIANSVNIAGHVEIGDFAILEGTVAVQQFVVIGAHCFIAGASLVRKDVPPFVKAAKEPLCYAGVNAIGLKRRNFSDNDIRHIEDIYRILYVQNNNVTKALSIVKSELPQSQFTELITSFVSGSEKGVIKGMI